VVANKKIDIDRKNVVNGCLAGQHGVKLESDVILNPMGPIGCKTESVLYYAGDFDPTNPNANGLADESDVVVDDSRIYQQFIFPTSNKIVNIFGNYLCDTSFTLADVDIRTGVSVGNGGTVVASYTGLTTTIFDTGVPAFGFELYTITVTLPAPLTLSAGTYYINLKPISSSFARSFHANTFGINQVNVFSPNNNYWNSAFFGENFCNANTAGVFPLFSSGVNSGFPPYSPANKVLNIVPDIKTKSKVFKIKKNYQHIRSQCIGSEISSCTDLNASEICNNFWQSPDQDGNSFQCGVSTTPKSFCAASKTVCSWNLISKNK